MSRYAATVPTVSESVRCFETCARRRRNITPAAYSIYLRHARRSFASLSPTMHGPVGGYGVGARMSRGSIDPIDRSRGRAGRPRRVARAGLYAMPNTRSRAERRAAPRRAARRAPVIVT